MWWFDTTLSPPPCAGVRRTRQRAFMTHTTRGSATGSPRKAGMTVILIALVILLPACGFHPMYGDRSDPATAANYSNIEIGNIPNRDGQYLRNQLIDRMYLDGRPAETIYALRIAPVKTITTNLGIRRDATATRAMVETDTTIQLVEKATGRVLLQRDIRATGGYNLLDNQFATIVSRQSVDDHMLEELAEDIVTELGLYFHRAGSDNPAEMPVSIAKPTRSPAVPITLPAVPGGDPAPKSDIMPVTPDDPAKITP